jgi:pyruvate ferredoxin oxidoreductase delta subunit
MTDNTRPPPCRLAPFERSAQLEGWPAAPQRASGALATSNRGWRSEWPLITLADCNLCGLCLLYCPDGAITWGPDGLPTVDADWCKGCGMCARECPKHIIAMSAEAAAAPE